MRYWPLFFVLLLAIGACTAPNTPTPTPTPVSTPPLTPVPLTPSPSPLPTLTPTPTPAQKPSPVHEPQSILMLPFTKEYEPKGMMPMGETVQHPREAPWGHPGIDFQWPYKAPLVSALGGEVVQILASESKLPGVIEYSVSVITNDFIVNYDVTELYTELYKVNPALDVGSIIATGQLIGYATPVGSGDEWHMTHWEFGTYTKADVPKRNPEGQVEWYRTDRLCPVPYFTEPERRRLSRIWGVASYNERNQFPDLCNGPYKNY